MYTPIDTHTYIHTCMNKHTYITTYQLLSFLGRAHIFWASSTPFLDVLSIGPSLMTIFILKDVFYYLFRCMYES